MASVYGIGDSNSNLLCKNLGFSRNLRVAEMSRLQRKSIIKTATLFDLQLGSDLKKARQLIFKNLIAIKSVKGLRRLRGLPIRGQRTHTNAKTARKRIQ